MTLADANPASERERSTARIERTSWLLFVFTAVGALSFLFLVFRGALGSSTPSVFDVAWRERPDVPHRCDVDHWESLPDDLDDAGGHFCGGGSHSGPALRRLGPFVLSLFCGPGGCGAQRIQDLSGRTYNAQLSDSPECGRTGDPAGPFPEFQLRASPDRRIVVLYTRDMPLVAVERGGSLLWSRGSSVLPPAWWCIASIALLIVGWFFRRVPRGWEPAKRCADRRFETTNGRTFNADVDPNVVDVLVRSTSLESRTPYRSIAVPDVRSATEIRRTNAARRLLVFGLAAVCMTWGGRTIFTGARWQMNAIWSSSRPNFCNVARARAATVAMQCDSHTHASLTRP